MRLMPALALGLSIAIAFTLITLSGVGSEIGQGESEMKIEQEFNETAESTDQDEFDPDEGGDSLLGSTLAALGTLRSLGSIMLFMPSALQSIGMPWWGARVMGHGLQLVFVLGIAQVIRGFEIR